MPVFPLTLHDREEIRAGVERDEPCAAIAARLGRHRSTISAEVRRNGGRDGYTAVEAQDRADAKLRRPKTAKLVADPELAAHITQRLEAKDSPMTISIELARNVHNVSGSVSHECIYQAIYAHGKRGLVKGLHTGLHRRRRCRKHRREQPKQKTSPLGLFNPIADRSPVASSRAQVGHLEGDLIVGSFNRSAIVTVFDRKSRHLWLADLPEGHGAEATLAALIELCERIPQRLRRTLTWDQGREMARHHDLTAAVGIDCYFADPHSPWQRPTNENGNALIRRYVGKSTNLSKYKDADLRTIEKRINTIPRRTLHWDTAEGVYNRAVALTD